MLKKLIFAVAILAIAGGAAYYFGLFKPSVNQAIEQGVNKAVEQTKEVVETVREKTK